eukprot:s241_g9.t1
MSGRLGSAFKRLSAAALIAVAVAATHAQAAKTSRTRTCPRRRPRSQVGEGAAEDTLPWEEGVQQQLQFAEAFEGQKATHRDLAQLRGYASLWAAGY